MTDRNRISLRDWQNIPKIDKYIMTQLWQTMQMDFFGKNKENVLKPVPCAEWGA